MLTCVQRCLLPSTLNTPVKAEPFIFTTITIRRLFKKKKNNKEFRTNTLGDLLTAHHRIFNVQNTRRSEILKGFQLLIRSVDKLKWELACSHLRKKRRFSLDRIVSGVLHPLHITYSSAISMLCAFEETDIIIL